MRQLKKPFVGLFKSLSELRTCRPALTLKAAHIHPFPPFLIRLDHLPVHLAGVADNLLHGRSQFTDQDIPAGTDIVGGASGLILYQELHSICQVTYIEELQPGSATTADGDITPLLGSLMKHAHHSRHYPESVFKPVVGTIQIAGDEGGIVAVILTPDRFTKFQPGQFCQTIPLMRSEEHTSELQSRGHLVCRL